MATVKNPDTHVLDWADDIAGDVGAPPTHAVRSALAAWALAASRDEVATAVAELFAVAGEGDEPVQLSDDHQRIRQALVVGADATTIARAVANAGGPDFTAYIDHVLDNDLSGFEPADIAAEARADAAIIEQRQAYDDSLPATRGDIRALTDSIAGLVDALRVRLPGRDEEGHHPVAPQTGPNAARTAATPPAARTAPKPATAPRKRTTAKKAAARKAPAAKKAATSTPAG